MNKIQVVGIKEKKLFLRKKVLSKRLNLDKKSRDEQSNAIVEKLSSLPEFRSAKNILFYIPIKNEIEVLPLIKESLKEKNVLLPKVIDEKNLAIYKIESLKNLEVGKFYIPEPTKTNKTVHPKNIQLILVPGIAFDHKGNRIGFGKGYYDILLSQTSAKKIALAYDFQIVDNVPGEPHDQPVDLILTPTKTILIT